MRPFSTLLLTAVMFLLGACSVQQGTAQCIFPSGIIMAAIKDSAYPGVNFEGILAVRMDEDFTEDWAYTGIDIQWMIAAWPEGAFTSPNPPFSQLALWFSDFDVTEQKIRLPAIQGNSRPTSKLQGLFSANAIAALTSDIPYIGPDLERDFIETRAYTNVFNCTRDWLKESGSNEPGTFMFHGDYSIPTLQQRSYSR